MSGWCWRNIDARLLSQRHVITTVHHIVPDKFGSTEMIEFAARDQITTAYHVPSRKTADQIRPLTQKPIHVIPFWINQNIWYHISDKSTLRKKFAFDQKQFLLGSFQRDTEGKDLITPKLEKGPDILCDIVHKYHKIYGESLNVILAGWRRQYVINRFQSMNVRFSYFEKIDLFSLNELYNCLNLYVVSSRFEGGPQAIVECGITKTPVISTDVGLASDFLHKSSIFEPDQSYLAIPDIAHAYEAVRPLSLPNGMLPFRRLLS
jgi:glycosyltransferase involved in cell wall biosynthesis